MQKYFLSVFEILGLFSKTTLTLLGLELSRSGVGGPFSPVSFCSNPCRYIKPRINAGVM